MAKAWPADFVTHINEEALQISTCFVLTRADGEVFRFTDHDLDIVFEGQRYEATSGYTRSSMSAKEDLSVDTLDLEGLIQSGTITESDLLGGKFDHAQFEMFLVKWGVTDYYTNADEVGSATLRKGRLGQLTIKDNTYEVEFRGMKQALGVVAGGVYQPTCRVDLFSAECGLTAASYQNPGVVSSVTDNRQFVAQAKETVSKKFDLTSILPIDGVESSKVGDYSITDLISVKLDAAGTGLIEADATPDGTKENPFELSSTTDVNVTLRASAAVPGLHWVLTSDIDFGSFGTFTPIQTFHGHLDGRGFKIIDLDTALFDNQDPNGLFGVIGNQGVVRRLALQDPNVGGTGSPSPSTNIHGQTAPLAAINNGLVEDSYSDGGTVRSNNVGYSKAGFISWNLGTAQGDDTSWYGTASGRSAGKGQIIRRCWSSTEIEGAGVSGNHFRVGGFVGFSTKRGESFLSFPDSTGSRFLTRGVVEDCFFDEDVSTWFTPGQGFIGGNRRIPNSGASFNSSTHVDEATDTVSRGSTDFSDSNIKTGDPISFSISSGALPAPMQEGVVYFFRKVDTSTAAFYFTRREADADTNRIALTQETGTFMLFTHSPAAAHLTTSTAQTKATHTGLDFFSMYKMPTSDYPKLLDPGRNGSGGTPITGSIVRTKGVDVSSLGTYQSSSVNWTATTPGSSSVEVYASTDGESFSQVASTGDAVPGLVAGVTSLTGMFVTLIVKLVASGSDKPTLTSLDFSLSNNTDQFSNSAGPPVLSPSDNDWFVKGQIQWTSGKNNGLTMEVKEWNALGKSFQLYMEMPFDIAVGDTFFALPGCRKRVSEDCNAKFGNIINFRGEPHVPGSDKFMQIADSTG